MRAYKTTRALLALLLVALLLSGCGGRENAQSPETPAVPESAAPTEEPETAETAPVPTDNAAEAIDEEHYETVVTVSTVERLLSSIAPHTLIKLRPGTYDLSTAPDYGQVRHEGYYTWEETYDGYQLVLRDLDDFALVGSGKDGVTIAAQSRYADVLSFRRCTDLLFADLTAGHSPEEGLCTGGVLSFDSCSGAQVRGCGLFGCGVMGVRARSCQELRVEESEIYSCSYGAVDAESCFDVRVENCLIRDCGDWMKYGYGAFALCAVSGTTGFALVNCDIEDNDSSSILNCRYSRETYMLGCGVSHNRVGESVFALENAVPVVDGCAFTGNIGGFYPEEYSGYAADTEGNDLISFDLSRMQRREAHYDGPTVPESMKVEPVREDGRLVYHVKTVDELLSSIGPNRTISLDQDCFDLSTASGYGSCGGAFYHWETGYDGPTLVIGGVSDLRLVGQGKDKTTILAEPRGADVLRFEGGERISLEGFTAGHTQTGDCVGDVLVFVEAEDVQIKDCGLYGCGAWAVRGADCSKLELTDCELYGCSSGALELCRCDAVELSGLDIHDMPSSETAVFADCGAVRYNGNLLSNGGHALG